MGTGRIKLIKTPLRFIGDRAAQVASNHCKHSESLKDLKGVYRDGVCKLEYSIDLGDLKNSKYSE